MNKFSIKKFWIFLIICLFVGGYKSKAKAQSPQAKPPFEVNSSVDKSMAVIGDVITYTLTISKTPEVDVDVAGFAGQLDGFKVIDKGGERPHDVNGRLVTQNWFKLQAVKIGSHYLPPIRITYKLKTDPQAKETQTTPIMIEVSSSMKAGKQLNDIIDIKPLETIRIDYKKWIIIGAIVLLIALLVAGISYYFKNKNVPKEEVIIKRPVHEVALEGLYRLQNEKYYGPEEIKKLYFELSEIFRFYLEGRYDFPASDWTSEEIVAYLNKNSELTFELKNQTKQFLLNTDLVKFAEQIPKDLQIKEELERAIQFVEVTKQVPVKTEESNNKESV